MQTDLEICNPYAGHTLNALKPKTAWLPGLIGLGLLALVPGAHAVIAAANAPSATFRTLYTFSGTTADGAYSSGALLLDMDGNFYGTAQSGGASGAGTVFELTPAGDYTTVYDFTGDNDGQAPTSGLVEDSAGNFYGATQGGGANLSGTVFEIGADGILSTVYTFGEFDGYEPNAVILGHDGNLYGTAIYGGDYDGGSVFEISTTGNFTPLHSFDNSDGSTPQAGVVEDGSGNLYGTTRYGGDNNEGTVFKIAADGTFSSLHSFGALDNSGFNTDGALPVAALIVGSDGDLYGVAQFGGTSGDGTVFKLTTDGQTFTPLYSFSGTDGNSENLDGAKPGAALVQGSDGNFYGVTQNGGTGTLGTLFQITPGGVLTTLHNFALPDGNGFNSDGGQPQAPLIEGSPGDFYGVTANTGANGVGTVFAFTVSPAITSPATATANVGSAFSYQIVGTNGPTSYSVSGLGDGLKFDDRTGVISGTPTATGSITVTISASNAAGSASATLTITVGGALSTITSATTASGVVGTPFSYQIVAGNSPTKYGATGLPGGLAIKPLTGVIFGTPKFAGTFMLTLHATNANGKTSAPLTLTITQPVPAIGNSATASATVGTAFTYQIVAANNPTIYGVQGLPAGLSINASTGVISGTPKTPGTYTLTLNAYNSAGKGTATLTLTVQPAGKPVVGNVTSVSGTVGAAFAYQITASNFPTSYGVQGLPAGLTVNASTGLISGTPTRAGTFTLTLNAYNSLGKGSAALPLTVAAAP